MKVRQYIAQMRQIIARVLIQNGRNRRLECLRHVLDADQRRRGSKGVYDCLQGLRLYWLTSMSNCLIFRCKLRRPSWIC